MNWRNVVRLVNVDIKSGRLIRGSQLRRYRENRTLQYLLYGGGVTIGLLVGLSVGFFYSSLLDLKFKGLIYQGALYVFLSLPILILLFSFIFTMMSQIQQGGMRLSVQVPYWLPITWEEHTLASVISHLIGFPLASIIAISLAVLTLSIFLKLFTLALFATFALLVSAFLASTTTDIFRVLQTRFIGAVYKSSGKAAVWVRFVGSILFLIFFYVLWFTITSGSNAIELVQTVASAQGSIWYVPYAWPGLALASFISENILNTFLCLIASVAFTFLLFFLAVRINVKFGLYEPPAITVSKGVYVPRTSFLERFGFSTSEVTLIRKDLRAFTRRRELMYIFILPLIIVLMPILGSAGQIQSSFSSFFSVWILLLPGALMSTSLGTIIIGEEGLSIWLIYSSPISASSLIKSKYTFVVSISCLVSIVCDIVGILVAHPSISLIVVSIIESFLLIFAIAAVSIGSGIKGAQFTEAPRPRMVNPVTSLVGSIISVVVSVIVLLPFLYYAARLLALPFIEFLPKINVPLAVTMSAVISFVIAFLFYKIALRNAKKFLANSQI
ncbi:MAG: hypothetical protein ABSB40_06460 [Nitrososphaeria archaeon]